MEEHRRNNQPIWTYYQLQGNDRTGSKRTDGRSNYKKAKFSKDFAPGASSLPTPELTTAVTMSDVARLL